MAVGWFIVPYKRREHSHRVIRYPAIDDYTADIRAHGGDWAETEILGNLCIVKVRAPDVVLSALANVDGFTRLPKDRLNAPLSDLGTTALRAVRDRLEGMGYPLSEIREQFGLNASDLANYTLRDVLVFAARRRLKPRYDSNADEIVLDGAVQACRPIADVDAEVADDVSNDVGDR